MIDDLTGRCTLPLMMELDGDLVRVGTTQVDLDLRDLRIGDDGKLFAVVDLHAED